MWLRKTPSRVRFWDKAWWRRSPENNNVLRQRQRASTTRLQPPLVNRPIVSTALSTVRRQPSLWERSSHRSAPSQSIRARNAALRDRQSTGTTGNLDEFRIRRANHRHRDRSGVGRPTLGYRRGGVSPTNIWSRVSHLGSRSWPVPSVAWVFAITQWSTHVCLCRLDRKSLTERPDRRQHLGEPCHNCRELRLRL